jgi:hypothetical protein
VETGFCPRLQVETNRRQRLALSIWQGSTWRRRQSPVSEILCFEQKIGRWIIPEVW